MKRSTRTGLAFLAGGLAAYVGGSYLAARRISGFLLSPRGLGPATTRREDLLAALRGSGAFVADYRHAGSARAPAALAAIFASPGEPQQHATILFLHGKGGASSEWQPDALRALRLGYNVLLPDLRGHPPSEGELVTYGFLEKDDLAIAVDAAHSRFGLDPDRIGLHACSAGSTAGLEFAALHEEVRALWIESPYADPAEMARHYISVATRLPAWLLGLTTRWAVARAVTRVRRELHLPDSGDAMSRIDPVRAVSRVRGRICLVYGENDALVPPRFAARLVAALPADAVVWRVEGAGHCHHEDEAARAVAQEYEMRWADFFAESLPAMRVRSPGAAVDNEEPPES